MPNPPKPDTRKPLAIITGASSGIGLATARLLATQGYRTLLIARRAERIEALAAELSTSEQSIALPLDLEDADIIESSLAQALEAHGPADVLINNAGHSICKPMLWQTLEDHKRIMQVHYFAAVQMIQATLPVMLDRKRGHIINVASIATKMGPWGHAAYAAAKCALVSLTQTMAADYAGRGVHFSYVNPGLVRTEFFDNPGYESIAPQVGKRAIAPEKVAQGILKLIRKPKLEMCIPRLYRILDWFKAVSPDWAHQIVTKGSTPAK